MKKKKQTKKDSTQSSKFSPIFIKRSIIFSMVFALIGCYYLIFANASTPNVAGGDYFGMNMMHMQWGNFSRAQVDSALDDAKNAGVHWIRLGVQWSDVQAGGPNSWSWTGSDKVVDSANARGIKVLALLTYSPKWAIDPQYQSINTKGEWEKYRPSNVNDFANFAGSAATHYSQKGVHHFEIWNEANNGNFYKPTTDVAHYTQMLNASYNTIKTADPNAVVISSGLSPYGHYGQMTSTNINPLNFLEGMYANGAKGHMDAIGWHPYNWDSGSPTQAVVWNAFYQMYGTTPSVLSIMQNNGDNKKIWMTEFGYPVGADSPKSVTYNNEPLQAQYLTEAYNKVISSSWAGPLFWYNYRDEAFGSSNESYGIKRADGSNRPSWNAYKVASQNAVGNATPDTTAPTNVAVVIPKANDTVAGKILLDASALDNKGVVKVAFYINNNFVGNARNTAYGWIFQDWDSTTVSDGTCSVFARAYDEANNMTQSASVTFRVLNHPNEGFGANQPSNENGASSSNGTTPNISVGSSSGAIPVSGSISLDAPIKDPENVSKIEYYIDGKPICTTSPRSTADCKLDTTALSNGEHTVTTKVFDKNGQVKITNQKINVNNHRKSWQKWWALAGLLIIPIVTILICVRKRKCIGKIKFNKLIAHKHK